MTLAIINHLAYANDVVIRIDGNNKSIRTYEKAYGQKVNANKSFSITAPKTGTRRINRIENATPNIWIRTFLLSIWNVQSTLDKRSIAILISW